MEYPRLVFISPGKNKCNGGTYDCIVVRDDGERKAALNEGYSDSVPEALESVGKQKEAIIAKIEAEEAAENDKPVVKRGRPAKEKE